MKNALLISCFDWYKTRLAPIRDYLNDLGYDVTILESDFDHIKKTPIENRFPECTYIHVPSYTSNISVSRIRSHLSFGKSVRQYIKNLEPDLIHIQVPPNNTARYCTEYKKKHTETRLILDIVDLWPESMPVGKIRNYLPGKIWKGWRNNCIATADHVFTECDLYRKELEEVLDKDKSSSLYLFKEQTEEERKKIIEIITTNNPKKNVVNFAFVGSMNNILDIEGVCSVMEKFKEAGNECIFHAIGDGEKREQFEQAVKAVGCIPYFHGAIFDEVKKIDILAPCDFAINMMKDSVSVGLTIKSIDYLSYGLPLINNIKGDTWQLIEETGIGINVGSEFQINKSINHGNVYQVFEERFSKESFVDQLKGVFF